MSEWISVKDEMPEVERLVLVYSSFDEAVVTDYLQGNGQFRFHGGITHWMPLPEPPKTDLRKCARCGRLVDKGDTYVLNGFSACNIPLMICDDCCSSFYKWFNEG